MTAHALQKLHIDNNSPISDITADLFITEAAYQRLKTLLPAESRSQNTLQRLRLRIDSGGCSGFQYNFKIDGDIHDDDLIYAYQEIFIITDDISLGFVKGSHIDFHEDLMGANFLIKNPNASAACGCGNSFSVM